MGNFGSHIENEAAYEAAIKRNILANAQKTFFATYEDGHALIEFLAGKPNNDFCKSLLGSFQQYGKLTPNQVAAVRSSIAKSAQWAIERKTQREANNAAACAGIDYFGTIGERVEMTFKVNKIIEMDGIYGMSYLHLATNDAGQTIVYKGTVRLSDEGETVTVKATVKEHTVFNGTKQTKIARPAKAK